MNLRRLAPIDRDDSDVNQRGKPDAFLDVDLTLPLSRAAISVAAACTHAAFILRLSSAVMRRISLSAFPQ